MNTKPTPLHALRAVTYSRYSSKLQNESSIEAQQRETHARAQAEGWTLVHDYCDRAMSGSDGHRPQFVEMQAAAARHEFDVLLLLNLSRLSRDSLDQETVIRDLEYEGIRIVTTSDAYDSLGGERELMRGIKGAMNAHYNVQLGKNIHAGFKTKALHRFWCGGRPYGYAIKLERDSKRLDLHGEPEKIGSRLVIDSKQRAIVKEIFERYVKRESCLSIARDLNARGVPSPGSSWNRTVRRNKGWMASGVRVILKNPRYTGRMIWNASKFEKHPKTKKDRRKARPQSEWITHQDEKLRIVSDAVYAAAQERTKVRSNSDERLRQGCKAAYLLSGLLKCSVCGANYVMGDAHKYVCSGYGNGRACANGVRVRRDALEEKVLGPVRQGLRDPERIALMAKRMQVGYAAKAQADEARATAVPRELQEIESRLAKLRARLVQGDDDLTAEDLQAAIDRAEGKRSELKAAQPAARQQAKILALLPKAAALYVKQIEEGLGGNERAVIRARHILRDMLGPVTLEPEADGSLWASYRLDPGVLVKTGIGGRGDRI